MEVLACVGSKVKIMNAEVIIFGWKRIPKPRDVISSWRKWLYPLALSFWLKLELILSTAASRSYKSTNHGYNHRSYMLWNPRQDDSNIKDIQHCLELLNFKLMETSWYICKQELQFFGLAAQGIACLGPGPVPLLSIAH